MSKRKVRKKRASKSVGLVVVAGGKRRWTTVEKFCAEHAAEEKLCDEVRAIVSGGELDVDLHGERFHVERPAVRVGRRRARKAKRPAGRRRPPALREQKNHNEHEPTKKRRRVKAKHKAVAKRGRGSKRRRAPKSAHKPLALLRSRYRRLEQVISERESAGED